MRPYACLIVLAGLTLASCVEAAPPSDPKAVQVADRVMKALGGEQRWNDLKGIRWSFGLETGDTVRSLRRHSWDKHTGWHRVEGKNRAGQAFCYIENLNDSTAGHAWVDGQAIEGDSLKKLMKLAKRLWTNDTYWMLMPYKLRDPGVRLRHEGKVREGDRDFEKLALSFDNVGQTPGDRYWIYVDSKTHRIVKWDYLLENEKETDHATWEGWQEHGGLWFPTAHRKAPNLNIYTRDVETVAAFRPGEFSAP